MSSLCGFGGCDSTSRSMGYCTSHYDQYHRYGTARDTTRLKDGQTKHPLYKTWQSLKLRCYNPTDPHYKWYGAKGVDVCERWTGKYGFYNFLEDMGERPRGYSLDRIDSNGNYEPSNCRWASAHTQNTNRTGYNTEYPGITKRENGNYRARLLSRGKSVFDKTFKDIKEAKNAIETAREELLCH